MDECYKLLLTFVFGFSLILSLQAQLPDGSIAQDWTLTDINGNEHSLYADYLDQGKSVIIDFSATWCGPCWNYHNTHIEKDLYEDFGPDGTDEIMVFQIEADFATNTNCLYGPSGCNNSTQGNWVAGTPYPIIDLQPADANVKSDYLLSYYPTLYAVCPDRKVYEVGQASYNTWKTWLLESCPLDASGTGTGVECYNDMDGTIDLTTFAGYGNLSFNWSNGSQSEDISNLFPGNYTCTISDQHNRSIETEEIIVAGPDSPPQVNIIELEDISCYGEGDGYVSLAGSGGSPGYSYEWSNGLTGPVQSGLESGTYTVTILDNQNCAEEMSIEIFEPSELIANVSGTDENCGGSDGSIVVSASGGNGNNYYDIGATGNYTGIFNSLPAGDYTVSVTDLNGCFVQLSHTLVNNLPPIADAGPAINLDCINTIVVLDGSGSETGSEIVYLWSTTDGNIVNGSTTLYPEVDEPGSYQIQVFNTNTGCISTDQVTVESIASIPLANAGFDATLDCTDTELQLNGTDSESGPNIIYSWTTADGNISEGEDTTEPIVNASGTYVLEVTNTLNGCTSTDEVLVEQNGDIPAANAGQNGILNCETLLVLLDGSGSEAGPDITYFWSTENGNIVEGQNTNQIMADAPGTYFLLVTNNSNGCANTDSVEIAEDLTLPQVEFEQQTITCAQQIATICAQSSDNVTFVWSNGSTASCTEVSTAGPIAVEVVGENGCSAQFETTIEDDLLLPNIELEENFVVDCNFVDLELIASGDTGDGFSLNWTTQDGNILEGENTDSLLVNAPGTYILEVVNVNTGCVSKDSVSFTQFFNSPIAGFSESINGAFIEFTDNSSGEPDFWDWSFGDGETSTDQNPNHMYSESGNYEVCLTIVNECGEDLDCHEIQVTISGAFNFSAVIDHLSCSDANDGSILISAFGGQPGYSISWSGPNGFSSDAFTITNLMAGIYYMELADNDGNMIAESFMIEQPTSIVYVPQLVQHASCFGDADGSIEGSATGGQMPLSYFWSTGDVIQSITDLLAGNYSCTITDANGCTETFEFEIEQPEELILIGEEIVDASNGEANGSIDISVSGGIEPYEYQWSNGNTTEDVENLLEGSYSCIITDANACVISLGPFEINNSTGIFEINGLNDLRYFPNPVAKKLFIELSFEEKSQFEIHLLNKFGQSESKETFDADACKVEIRLDHLSEGIYFLMISKAGQSIIKKIIVQH